MRPKADTILNKGAMGGMEQEGFARAQKDERAYEQNSRLFETSATEVAVPSLSVMDGGVREKTTSEPALRADAEAQQALQTKLAALLAPAQLSVAFTKNQSIMISVRRRTLHYTVRLHEMFVQGDEPVVQQLASFIRSPRPPAARALREFVRRWSEQYGLQPTSVRRKQGLPLRSIGEVHQLQPIYEELNQRYFENQIAANITWGRRSKLSGTRRSIRMGSYSVEDRLIRIHPVLDQVFVPRYFVAWIVYHEMLHQRYEIQTFAGRRRFHPPAFVAEERLFEEYVRAKQWERTNLNRLLRG